MCNKLWAKLLLFILILTNSCMFAFAVSSEYQNNLSGIEVQKNADESLGLTLFMDEPYGDTINVMKKNDTEYVLLLPEISNSLSAREVKNKLKKQTDGIVKDVELKHFEYPNTKGNNGYTKVVIKTDKPVDVFAKVSTTQNIEQKQSVEKKILPKKEIIEKKVVEEFVFPEIQLEKAKQPPTTKQSTPVQSPKKVQQPKTVVQKNYTQQKTTPKTVDKEPSTKKENIPPKVYTPQNTQTQTKASVVTAEDTAIMPEVSYNDEILDKPIEFLQEDAITFDEPNEKTYEKQNKKIPFWLIVVIGIAGLIVKKITLSNNNPKNILKETMMKKQSRKKNYTSSKLQTQLQTIMDNSSLTWQERYRMLKKQEETAVKDKNVKFADEEINRLADKYSASKAEIYEQNFGEFFQDSETETSQRMENQSAPTLQKLPQKNKDMPENTEEKNFSKNKKNIIYDGITPQQRAFGIQGNIHGLTSPDKSKQSLAPQVKKEQELQEKPELIGEVKISPEKGFYLTRFEKQLSLIGYDKNNVYVIKKFGSKEIKTIQARLNEATPNKLTYIVKADDYKALVEVTDKMQLLLEL